MDANIETMKRKMEKKDCFRPCGRGLSVVLILQIEFVINCVESSLLYPDSECTMNPREDQSLNRLSLIAVNPGSYAGILKFLLLLHWKPEVF